MRTCRSCNVKKPLSEYEPTPQSRHKYKNTCYECAARRARKRIAVGFDIENCLNFIRGKFAPTGDYHDDECSAVI